MSERFSKRISKFVADILFPLNVWCVSCNSVCVQSDEWLCVDCLTELNDVFDAYQPGEHVISAYPYSSPAGAIARGLKYHGLSGLVPRMAEAMLKAAEMRGMPAPDVITYVPMSRRRRMDRYNNHAFLLARAVGTYYGLSPTDALARVRSGKPQARINNPIERASNVSGAFSPKIKLSGELVFLIDDVYTTGATAKDCSRALYDAGAGDVWVLTYACAHAKNE